MPSWDTDESVSQPIHIQEAQQVLEDFCLLAFLGCQPVASRVCSVYFMVGSRRWVSSLKAFCADSRWRITAGMDTAGACSDAQVRERFPRSDPNLGSQMHTQ